jgi:hypothetical protein
VSLAGDCQAGEKPDMQFIQITSSDDPGIQQDQVVSVWESQNVPTISVPGRGLLSAHCHVISVVFLSGRYSVFLCLSHPGNPQPTYFVPDPLDCDAQLVPGLLADAVVFAESMGFMMTDLELEKQPRQKALDVIGKLPFLNLEFQTASPTGLDLDSVAAAQIPGEGPIGIDRDTVQDTDGGLIDWNDTNRQTLARFLADY